MMGTVITNVSGEVEPKKDIHTWFSLTYANYLVLPRTLLQSMPEEWQHRFVGCLDELNAAFAHIEQAESYEVTPGVEREVGDLSDAELTYLGITRDERTGDDPDMDDAGETHYYDRDGNEMESWWRVVWPKPDPVPHYSRGRTHIEPRLS